MIDNHEIVDQESIANVLNEFFANIGSDLARSIPSVTQTARQFMPPPICDSLLLSPVTANEIEVEIAKLNASKAVDSSNIPIVILKILKCELSGKGWRWHAMETKCFVLFCRLCRRLVAEGHPKV